MPEIKEVLKHNKKQNKQTHNDGDKSMEHKSWLKELPMAMLEQFEPHIK